MTDTPEDALLTFLRAAPVDDEPEDKGAHMIANWCPQHATMHCNCPDRVEQPQEVVRAIRRENVAAERMRIAEARYDDLIAALATQRALVAELVGALEGLLEWTDLEMTNPRVLVAMAARAALERAAKEQP